uniref:Uncharacterized protein n=1 Tax=Timema monikensis TaxID=170555 RepID=A0A7R9E9G2_9NEOP|nr:unnamed protein product [Timema monikensis]
MTLFEPSPHSTGHTFKKPSLHLITPSCKLWSANPIDVPFADPFWAFYWPGGSNSRVAIALNEALNKVTVDISSGNLIRKTQLKWDCVLIGDMFYNEILARGGALVLVGDPGRTLLQQEMCNSSDIFVAQYTLLDNTYLENNGFTDTFV